jgi:hypothetical protein
VGCSREDVVAYWAHALQMTLINSLPLSLLNAVMIKTALQKKEEEEKSGKSE